MADPPENTAPEEQKLEGKSYTQSRLDEVMRVQDKYTPQIMAHEGVFGTATGEDDNGNPVILVYTQRHGIIKKLPGQFEGIPLEQSVAGTSFRAGPSYHAGFKGALNPPGGLEPQAKSPQGAGTGIPTDPTQQFTPPLPIGVSMTNSEDPICSSGTIGCRIVFADGRLGALTNSHVAAHESQITASPEDLAAGVLGDHWTQPGCADLLTVAVNPTPFTFARLIDFQTFIFTGQTTTGPIVFDPSLINHIDAAVGRISFPNDSLLLACTPDDGYGFPSRTPVAPVPGMRVMKYGRTTGLRRGKIRGINANVAVLYSTDLALFSNQISIYGDHSLFSMAGDSGSLVVTENGHHPVGLLFAGGGFETLANPIGLVLERFNIAIDDGTGTPPRQGANGATTTPGAGQSGRMGGAGGRIVNP